MDCICLLGSNLDKGSSSLELEFDKYSLPLCFPKEQEIYAFSEFLAKNEDILLSSSSSAPQEDHVRISTTILN